MFESSNPSESIHNGIIGGEGIYHVSNLEAGRYYVEYSATRLEESIKSSYIDIVNIGINQISFSIQN